MTNYEKIKNMSVEEMATALFGINDETIHYCKNLIECEEALDNDTDIPESRCCECLKCWLESEVKPND